MEEMLRRARDGGYHALFVTVDVPVIGLREGEVRRGMGAPPTLTPRRILDGALHPMTTPTPSDTLKTATARDFRTRTSE